MPNGPILTQEEQTQAVKELQENLRVLSQLYTGIPHVAVDGIYSLDTKMALMAFQKQFGLQESGIGDYETWNAVMREAAKARESLAPARPVAAFKPSHMIIKPGDAGDIVSILQILLRSVGGYLPAPITVEVNGIYDGCTANAVKSIQEMADIGQTGCVDKTTWNALTDIYNHVR